ncbi:hypothetical protein L7F22_015838 [Adiantum nelumboides]|nr:hypothetical protein [Adiantum nelumboides]
MDHEGHSGTPQVSPVKAIKLNALLSLDNKMQSNKHVRRRVREASQTPISVKRLSKAPCTQAALVDKDEMYAYVKEEMAKAEARMLKCMTAFKSEMMGEMHALGTSMYAKWKEEMQTYSQQEMAAQLKAELVPLEGKIHAFMAKDMLKLDLPEKIFLDAFDLPHFLPTINQVEEVLCGNIELWVELEVMELQYVEIERALMHVWMENATTDTQTWGSTCKTMVRSFVGNLIQAHLGSKKFELLMGCLRHVVGANDELYCSSSMCLIVMALVHR